MRPFFFSFLLALCVILPSSEFVHAADQTLEISQDGSEPVSYQVALDEIYTPENGLQTIPVQASLENLRILAVDLILATKEEIFLVVYPPGEKRTAENRRIITDKIVIEADKDTAASLNEQEGVYSVNPVGFAPGHYTVTVTNPTETLKTAEEIKGLPGVRSVQPQIAREMEKRATPNDPLFPRQWHLENTGQNGGTIGMDLNVVSVWDNFRGNGQVIGIVDDGLETTHEDLVANYRPSLSYDFHDDDPDPSPNLAANDFHGTACAGVAAAEFNNGTGVSGVAPAASLAGIRLLGGAITDLQTANAISFKNDAIQIKSNSWGPFALTLSGPGPLTRLAMKDAAMNGRSRKGTILLWAGGNDSQIGDNVNYDGFANSIYAFAIGALDDRGIRASYSEPGACLVVVAPSSSAGQQGITTTDIEGAAGYNSAEFPLAGPPDVNYTSSFGGTSSATPAVAGVVALLLDAKPSLTWREIKNILIHTARKVDSLGGDWIVNGAGLNFSHWYGAGLIDAAAAINMARTAPRLPAMREDSFSATGLPLAIPENNPVGITVTIPVSTSIRTLEHVVLEFSAEHTYRGDLKITLTSPFGTESVLATPHGDGGNNYSSWPFMTVRNWGEDPNGDWVLHVSDEQGIDVGSLTGAKLVLYGNHSSSSTSPGPSGSDNVVVTIASPTNGTDSPRGHGKVSGSATSSTGTLERVEYRHFTFGTISKNTKPELGWKPASGTGDWYFDANLVRGENIFQVRAVNRLNETSHVKTVRVLVR